MKKTEQRPPRKEGPALFFDVLRHRLWDLCKLNLILLLFCIPVVTIPTALTAMARVQLDMLAGKPGPVFAAFLQTVKTRWKRATFAGLIYYALLAAAVYGFYYDSAVSGNLLFYTVLLFAVALLLIAGFYLFPLLAATDWAPAGIFKSALRLTFSRLPQNILALTVFVVAVYLAWAYFPYSAVVLVLILCSLLGLITIFCAHTGFLAKKTLDKKP